jgi:hypothetical protein
MTQETNCLKRIRALQDRRRGQPQWLDWGLSVEIGSEVAASSDGGFGAVAFTAMPCLGMALWTAVPVAYAVREAVRSAVEN